MVAIPTVFFEILVVNEGMDVIGFPDQPSDKYLSEYSALDSDNPLLERWRPMALHFDHEEGTRKTDFYDAPTCVCVLSASANVCDDIDGLELLPVRVKEVPPFCPSPDPFGYLLHFTSRVSLLPPSVVEYFPGTKSIASMESALVSSDAIRNRKIFQLEGNPVSLYCTSNFKDEFIARNMTGIEFENISDIMQSVSP